MASLSLPRALGNTHDHTPALIARRAVAMLDQCARASRHGDRRVYGIGCDRDGRLALDYLDAIPITELRIAVTQETQESDIAQEFAQ